ncbi:hypothetical protein SAMN05421833_110181 [Microbispora rosea]|uniref:Uncharacterized protein n=1 Tax=Microbispora rosea TaxID=58117 RepID=A0A1N7BU56_9ACTN|nr:hypothetical protein Mro03_73390 [Microbispora rosea subsp. rosea]SIR54840.1 hypothetical protein SAMN05421833_110181 [Microbispora rosea]
MNLVFEFSVTPATGYRPAPHTGPFCHGRHFLRRGLRCAAGPGSTPTPKTRAHPLSRKENYEHYHR